jgi:hypothetical protein
MLRNTHYLAITKITALHGNRYMIIFMVKMQSFFMLQGGGKYRNQRSLNHNVIF